MARYATFEDRIIANTALAPCDDARYWYDGTPCWLWLRALNSAGYAYMCVRLKRGPRKGQPRMRLVHRLVLKHFKGVRLHSRRRQGLHLCNNRPCVSPLHLVDGSASENMRQMVEQNRHWSGAWGKKPREPGEEG